MKPVFFLLIFLNLLFSSSGGYGEEKELIVLGDRNYPPHEFIDSSGNPAGFNIDLIKAVAREMGFPVRINLCEWKVARESLENGKCDIISGMFYSEDRDLLVDFSIPHSFVSGAVFLPADSAVKSFEELKDKKVLVQNSDILHDFAVNNNFSNLTTTDYQANALVLLSKGNYDGALVARSQGLYIAKQLKLGNLKVLDRPLFTKEYCFAVAEGNLKLLSLLNEGLRILKETGEYKKIYDKWFGIIEQDSFDFRRLIKYLVFIVLSFLVLILFSFIWLWLLNAKVKAKTSELQAEITERKKIEKALRESEEKHRGLLEQLNEAVYHMSIPDGKYLYVSKAAESIFGYSAQELMNCPMMIRKIIAPEFMDYFDVEWHRLINGVVSPSYTYKIIDKEMKERWIHQNNSGVYDDNGLITGIIGCCENITVRIKAEQERESLIKKLEEQNEELERFTYTVSHDLKSPLTTIQGFISVLKNEYMKGDYHNAQQYFDRILNSTNRMYEMLCELLEFARLGRLAMTREEFDFKSLVKEVIDCLSLEIRGNKRSFRISDALPYVYADRKRMAEVMTNLFENALKFTNGVSDSPIDIGICRRDSEDVFFVKDNGIGIDPKYREKIFELFTKLDSSSNGNGVGLSIVKRIIELHGGTIWVESEPNKGSTFFFTIPRHDMPAKPV